VRGRSQAEDESAEADARAFAPSQTEAVVLVRSHASQLDSAAEPPRPGGAKGCDCVGGLWEEGEEKSVHAPGGPVMRGAAGGRGRFPAGSGAGGGMGRCGWWCCCCS